MDQSDILSFTWMRFIGNNSKMKKDKNLCFVFYFNTENTALYERWHETSIISIQVALQQLQDFKSDNNNKCSTSILGPTLCIHNGNK